MKKLRFPSAQAILLLITAMVTLLTHFVPSGTYDQLSYDAEASEFVRSGGERLKASQQTLDSLGVQIPLEKFTSGAIYKPISIPGTYQQVESKRQGIVAFLLAPIKGIIAAADIIFLVLIIGGLIGVMNQSQAFDAGISWLTETLRGREYWLIILVTSLIALGGTTFGLAEETMAFYPILIPVFIAARYDAMVGLACVFLGSSIGTMVSTTNPFSTIIASDSSGINWTTGLGSRATFLAVCLTICILYILRYAQRVRKDPSKSVIFDQKEQIEALFGQKEGLGVALTGRLRLILALFSACFVLMIYGVSHLDWWFEEMITIFFFGAILIGFTAQMRESVFLESFAKGAGDLLNVAFIIGIARGVSIIMDDGKISGTMLHYASDLTSGMNSGIFINLMMFIYSGLSFFIPSSSGMAVLTMPIMSPLADTVGIGRELIVDAYQYGMGIFHFINPTGLILASLAIVKVGFDRWLKFVMPLFIIILLLSMAWLTGSAWA